MGAGVGAMTVTVALPVRLAFVALTSASPASTAVNVTEAFPSEPCLSLEIRV